MANDQTLPRGDQGADAAQQERQDWCDRLLKALGGSANPELIASVSDGAEKAAGLVGTDAAALTPADLDGIATVDRRGDGDLPRLSIEHRFTDVFVRRGASWLVAHIRAAAPRD